MPRFRSARAQAEHAVSKKVSLGKGRHDHQGDGRVHSVGTARGYEQALKGFVEYLQTHKLGDLGSATVKEAQQYLAIRADLVAQKTLDLDRQAIQMHLGSQIKVVKSHKETILSTRSYTPAQVERIASAQTERNALATRIAYSAGLRAHELLTLRPSGERHKVEGKGGLVREVMLSKDLAERLEARRLADPRQVTDRGIHYVQRYDLSGGRNWSQSFSAASKRDLGYSTGAHGLRHSYAQERMQELQKNGMHYDAARQTVDQEVGHFDKTTTEAYLR